MEPLAKPRLYYIDNLRWLMIIFVVLMHVNVTYSMLGGWYYIEKSKLDLFQTIYFGMYGAFTQAYFMGFLFFLAGYFAPSSYDRKGFGKFTKERFIRLGVPTLVYMLFIHPLTIIILNYYMNWNLNIPAEYLKNIISLKFIANSGPLWFAFALLIFSIMYGVIRKLFSSNRLRKIKTPSINSKQIFIVAILITVFTFLTRLIFPIGTNILNMQLCFFPQYIVLFILGIIFFRRDLLQTIPYQLGMKWFRYTLIFGTFIWFLIIYFADVPNKGIQQIEGHFGWQSASYSLWESFFCVGICLGLTVWFREKFNYQHRLNKFLSDNAFGVYVFHAPVLVLISMWLREIAIYPFFKYFIVAVITIPLCFLISHFTRKIPGIGYILK